MRIKAIEVLLIAVGMFLVTSASLYWYDKINKSRPHTVEMEMRKQWERDTTGWQSNVTANINSISQWQKQVTDLLNRNIESGRLK